MFKVIRPTNQLANSYLERTEHIAERKGRAELVAKLGGTPVYSFLVDKGHKGGLEVHTLLDSGVIAIGNYKNHRLITWLLPFPNQVKRYGVNDALLLAKAYENKANGYNLIK